MRKGTLAMALAVALAASGARAAVVFGNFEGSQSDGFKSFTSSGPVDFSADTTGTTYSYSTIGATLGSTSLDVTKAGFATNLAYDFKANGHAADFMANDILSFDLTCPISAATSGYWQIYNIVLNAPGLGFTTVSGASPYFNVSPAYNGQTNTLSINYDTYKALISANPGYLQLVITVNDGAGAPPDFYFDNFRLSAVTPVPEPGMAGLAAVGGLGLLAGRRR